MKFRHPHVENGSISHEDGVFEITDGILEAPDHVGHGLGLSVVKGESRAPETPEVPEVLKGSVAEVTDALELVESVEELAALEVAEVAGKNRKGVLEAIDSRRAELTQ